MDEEKINRVRIK